MDVKKTRLGDVRHRTIVKHDDDSLGSVVVGRGSAALYMQLCLTPTPARQAPVPQSAIPGGSSLASAGVERASEWRCQA